MPLFQRITERMPDRPALDADSASSFRSPPLCTVPDHRSALLLAPGVSLVLSSGAATPRGHMGDSDGAISSDTAILTQYQ